jgi:hypothetical protein
VVIGPLLLVASGGPPFDLVPQKAKMAVLREYFGRSTFKIDLARQQIVGQRLDFGPAKE